MEEPWTVVSYEGSPDWYVGNLALVKKPGSNVITIPDLPVGYFPLIHPMQAHLHLVVVLVYESPNPGTKQ